MLASGLTLPAQAATTTLTLLGTVTDASNNAPCVGATVQVDYGTTTITGSQGQYVLNNLTIDTSPGYYHYFIISKTGYASYREENPSYIPAGGTTTHNATVYVGALISGTVRDAVTSAALAGATITANSRGNSSYNKVFSQLDGTYSLRQSPGDMWFYASNSGHADSMQKELTVNDGAAYTFDFSLYQGGTISGTVKYGDTTATVANACIQARLPNSRSSVPVSITYTAADGTYQLMHVYPGKNDVSASPTGTGWANAYRYNVDVPDQGTAANIDFKLQAGGSLQGTVQDYSGAGVINADVIAYPNNGNITNTQQIKTGTGGFYSFTGLPLGGYSLTIKPQQGGNLQIAQISGITIASGPASVRNATLQLGGKIRGTIRDTGGQGVANANISLDLDLQYPFQEVYRVTSDASGTYQVDGLSPYQSYTLSVQAPSTGTILAVQVKRSINVGEGETRQEDFTLSAGGGRSGVVMSSDGQLVSKGTAVAFNSVIGIGVDFDSLSGSYILTSLVEGDYLFVVAPSSGNWQRFTGFMHVTAEVMDAYNITLTQGGSLDGQVTDAGGQPVSNVRIRILDKMGTLSSINFFDVETFTDSNGSYHLEGLTTGTYAVEALPQVQDNGGPASRKVDDVVISAGQTQVQNIVLPTGTKVYGTVRDQLGNRIINGAVFFWSDTQTSAYASVNLDESGTYTVMLPQGTYKAQAYYTSTLGTNLGMEPYPSVTVPAAPQTLQKEFVLQIGGTLSGSVMDALGNPVSLALVQVYQEDNPLPARIALTDASGQYRIMGLQTGSYYLQAQATGYTFNRIRVDGIALGANTVQTNLVMVAQTTIGGTVTDKNQRKIKEAVVQALDPASGTVVVQTSADDQGAFVLQSLSGGPFTVKAVAPGLKSETHTGLNAGDRTDFVLEPLINKDEVISYPNPCRGSSLTFLFWAEKTGTALIRVYNQTGELVWDWEGAVSGPKFNRRGWQVSGVAPGVYLYKIKTRYEDGSEVNSTVGKLTVLK
jgi:protocatechuate 3,4-dioxygenase beta subunit